MTKIVEDLDSHLWETLKEKLSPIYDTFDPGHDSRHMLSVTSNAVEYFWELLHLLHNVKNVKLNINVVITAAAMHDIGLVDGRVDHHLRGYALFREHGGEYRNLVESFFTKKQLKEIAWAILEHRASYEGPVSSYTSALVSLADRGDFDMRKYVRRSYDYNVANTPDKPVEEIREDVYNHMINKYGLNGYAWKNLKLRLPSIETRIDKAVAFCADKKTFDSVFNALIV
jgi:HD superfamily phosphodiesterase